MIVLFELFLWLTYIYDIRRQMQIYGAHGLVPTVLFTGTPYSQCNTPAAIRSGNPNPQDVIASSSTSRAPTRWGTSHAASAQSLPNFS